MIKYNYVMSARCWLRISRLQGPPVFWFLLYFIPISNVVGPLPRGDLRKPTKKWLIIVTDSLKRSKCKTNFSNKVLPVRNPHIVKVRGISPHWKSVFLGAKKITTHTHISVTTHSFLVLVCNQTNILPYILTVTCLKRNYLLKKNRWLQFTFRTNEF